MNIIKYRNWFFVLSLLIIIPGIIALSVWGLRLGIDFAGGTLWEMKFEKGNIETSQLHQVLNLEKTEVSSIAATSQNSFLVRLKITDEAKINDLKDKLTKDFGRVEDVRLETVGPIISKELTRKAATAVLISILAIVAYVTWAFRQVPKPATSIAFGITTIIALIHDVIVVVGIFAILGHFFEIEVDSLFITALLTVIGFSVHDTIVTFDRLRENLRHHQIGIFEEVMNTSINQTIVRSLNTSLTTLLVAVAIILFGGESVRPLAFVMAVGIIVGTYSSIFIASPILLWASRRYIK